MEDTEKIRLTKDAFNRKLSSIDTWANFKSMISVITKAKVKVFLKNNLDTRAQDIKDHATAETGSAGTGGIAKEIEDLATEVNNI